MQLHCLGTVGYHPNRHRHTSCYFLPESGILLDCGSGAFRLAPLIQTETLDILLSHAHLDHTIGLTFLLDILHQCDQAGRPVSQLRIWGQADKLDAIQKHLFHDLIFPAALDCQWMPVDDLDGFQLGQARVYTREQPHPGGSVAYRIDWPSEGGKRLVYATDTTGDTSAAHADWSRGADLLMHECYFRDSAAEWAQKTGHSWSSRVAEVAANSQPKKLLITHINPLEDSEDPVDLPTIRAKVKGDVMLAVDEMIVEF